MRKLVIVEFSKWNKSKLMAVPTFRNAKSVYPPFRPSYISLVARGRWMESLKFIHESGRKLPRRKHSLRHTSSSRSCFIVAVEEIRTRWKRSISSSSGRAEELESKVSRRNLGRGLSARPRSREDRGRVSWKFSARREVGKQESCGRRSMEGLTIILCRFLTFLLILSTICPSRETVLFILPNGGKCSLLE